MGNININDIETIYNAFTDGFVKTDDIKLISDLIHKEFTSYIDGITDFFVGNKPNIERIYTAIHNNTHPYNKIKYLNVINIGKVYNDYREGLESYIWKIQDVKETDQISVEKINDVINKIAEKNVNFIDELFRNILLDNNFETESDIDNAMYMVEHLLELRDSLKMHIVNIDKMISASSKDYEFRAVKIYIESLRAFIMRSIKAIVDCYNKIIISLENRTPVNGTEESVQYKIF